MMTHLSLRLRVFLFFCLLALGCAVIVAAANYIALSRFDPANPLSAFLSAGLMAIFPILGLVLAIWRLFDENVAKSVETISAAMRARAHGGVSHELDGTAARYLGDLAPAASAVTEKLVETTHSVEQAIARQTAILESQSEKLKALVSDVPVGLIICSSAHQMVFYNAPAKDLLAGTRPPPAQPVGIRSVARRPDPQDL